LQRAEYLLLSQTSLADDANRGAVIGGRVLIWIAHLLTLLTLLGFGGRWHWYLETMGHFRVQYLVLLLVCGTLFWLAARWRRALVTTGVAAVNLAVVLPFYFVAPTANSTGVSMTAVAANVKFPNRQRGRLLHYVRQVDPDWLALMEITPSWARTLQPLDESYPFCVKISRRGGFGMALYSRYRWSEARTIPLGDEADYCLRVRTRVAGRKWTLFVVHTASPSSAQRVASRNHQLSCLADLVKRESDPVMIMGDLNITSWSPVFSDLLSSTGLRDSRRGWGVQPSWPCGFPLFQIPIDHCLVSPEIAVLQRSLGADVGSDHLPVFVEVAVQR